MRAVIAEIEAIFMMFHPFVWFPAAGSLANR
jgi:hypothetical protein